LGVPEKTPFFRFHDQEIAAMFDPHHLLICMLNLLLKHNVTTVGFEVVVNGQKLTGTTKWADILKVYEIDKENIPYLLCNVTDRQLKPLAQDAMKAILPAQLMSSTVAAAIHTQVPAGKEN
jgi:hypothetical protein